MNEMIENQNKNKNNFQLLSGSKTLFILSLSKLKGVGFRSNKSVIFVNFIVVCF